MQNYSDNRSVLNVLFHPQHPDIFECAYERHSIYSKQCLMPGVMVEILSFIAKKANLTLKLTMDYDILYDYEDICRRLNQGEIDVFGSTVRSMSTLRENCDLSVTLYSVKPYIFTKTIDHVGSGWWNLMTIYDKFTWLFILLSILLESTFIYLISKCEQRLGLDTSISATNIIWKMFRIQLYQSESTRFKLSSGNLSITLFALLHGPIMLGIYSSSCLAALMRTPDQRTLQSEHYIFENLRKGRKKLVSWGPMENFREQIFNHSEQKFLDLQRAVGDNGLETHLTFHAILDSFNHHHNYVYDYKNTGIGLKLLESCDTNVAHIYLPPVTRHLMLTKNSPHTKAINEAIEQNHAKIISIYRSYISRMSSTVCKSYRIGDPLKLSFYYGVLLVCSGILTVSLGLLLLERLHFKFKRLNRAIQSICE
ncbi:unnamed protein product [Bursaphelenchus xylophilus]|uniref:(pine wood nematode) hypothetical protein n=1 Tax=Bursaphelenchus xylophilus TaxID=6326 RepID=A0A1I7RJK1_BURXY|nr:unnamed protein product [Bursaphelenchus xylophilus]CAG9128925.1 unnamed protein product [Bursaphelenchus xylophilus]